MKRTVPLIITASVGLLLIVANFVPSLSELSEDGTTFFSIIAAIAFVAFGLMGYAAPTGHEYEGQALISLPDLALLLGVSLGLVWLLRNSGIPILMMVCPLVASAVLRMAGLVESVRGANGGYRLSREAGAISVWDAIHALDDSFLPGTTCDCSPTERLDCQRTTTCAVTSLWRTLGRDIRQSLEAVSLADLCAGALETTEPVELPTLSRSSSVPH